MASLTGQTVASTYPILLKIETSPLNTVFKTVEAGNGTDSALQLATTGIKSQGTFESTGAAVVGGAITVTGLSTLNAGATITGAVTVTGAATVSTTLGVTGVLTATGGVVGALTGAVTGNTAGTHTGAVNGTVGATTPTTGAFTSVSSTKGHFGFTDTNWNLSAANFYLQGQAYMTGSVGIGVQSPTVALDVNGAINATGTITGALTGNTTGVHTGAVVGNVTGDTAGVHTGAVTGNVTGNATGSSGSCTGNSATATALATTRNIALTGVVTGNVNFDGSANVSITTSGGGTITSVSDQANSSTGYLDLPVGTTVERPASPASGNSRYNTTLAALEYYTGSAWESSATAASTLTQFSASGSAPVYACRAWVSFNGSTAGSDPLTLTRDGFGNVASVVRTGTGKYTITFTTAMPDAFYCMSGMAIEESATGDGMAVSIAHGSTPTSGSFQITVVEDAGTYFNASRVTVMVVR